MKIALDAGHGLYTAGKRCLRSLDPGETREWFLNDRIAARVITHLNRCGIETLRLDDPTGKTDVALPKRSGAANTAKADYCVSIHHNAGANGTAAGGAVVFVYSGKHSAKSDELQKNVYDGLIAAVGKFGNRSKPLASDDLHMVRETNMPSVLVEVGFMDSKTDVPLILDAAWAAKAAVGIAKGICATAGVAWVEEFTPYLARVTANELTIRADAAAKSAKVGALVKGEVVRIAEERLNGTTRWGRLNLGLGWISLGYTALV